MADSLLLPAYERLVREGKIAAHTYREKKGSVRKQKMAVSKSSSSFLKWLLDPKKNFLAAMHKSALDKRLRKYGTFSSPSLAILVLRTIQFVLVDWFMMLYMALIRSEVR